MQITEMGYASTVNVTESRTRRKVTGEPRTLEKGFSPKGIPRRAPYPVS